MNVPADVRKLVLGIGGITGLALLFFQWTYVLNAATVALSFLTIVLFVAATARLWVAVTTSVVAALVFNFFFLPPIGTFSISGPENWVALFVFLAVSLVASNLAAVARARTQEAEARRDELGRLFDLSRDILLITDSRAANASLAGFISSRFDLDCVAICVPQGTEWAVIEAGPQRLTLDPRELSAVFHQAEDGEAPSGGGAPARFVPLRLGAKPIGLLAS